MGKVIKKYKGIPRSWWNFVDTLRTNQQFNKLEVFVNLKQAGIIKTCKVSYKTFKVINAESIIACYNKLVVMITTGKSFSELDHKES